MFHVPDHCRVTTGAVRSSTADGNNGAFSIKHPRAESRLGFRIIASDGFGWEHVSVSLPSRTPTWWEMCWVKDLFWDEEDCVVQFHPPKSLHINCHEFCLHMWRNPGRPIELPPSIMVGPRPIFG